jgi:flagellin
MIINHNIAALNTYNQLTANSASMNKSLAKLSSGLRINSAADDAAGLAISQKMQGQVEGLDQASRNAQDGISLIQTGEGALNETQSILQRMRELAVQSASDTNTDQDRKNIQLELNSLETEIDRIGNTTQFNTKNLIDGSMGAASAAVANVNTSAIFTNTAATGVPAATSGTTLINLADSNKNSLGIVVGDTVTVSYFTHDGSFVSSPITVASGTTLANLGSGIADGGLAVSAATGSVGALVVTASATGTYNALNGLTITVRDSSGNIKTAATNALSSFVETTAAANQRTNDGRATIQIGANSNQSLTLNFSDMRASALGVAGLDVTSQTKANTAVNALDTAIQKVSSQRATMGALQNRLEHTINNLGTSSQNLTSAQSRIQDVDMAQEMMNYTKLSIINQAATAMLAQANQQPQSVLKLLQ